MDKGVFHLYKLDGVSNFLYKDIINFLLGLALLGFLVGDFNGFFIWVFHGILTGSFDQEGFTLVMFFGTIYFILGLTIGFVLIVASAFGFNDMKILMNGSIVLVLILSLLSIIGVIEYQEMIMLITAASDKFATEYPLTRYIVCIYILCGTCYCYLSKYGKRERASAIVRYIFFGMALLMVLVYIVLVTLVLSEIITAHL